MELNNFLSEYYELFADLETNRAQFSEEFYVAARKLLLKQFEQATVCFLDEQELEFAERRFRLRFEVANYTPRRRWLFWWNRKAKALLRRYRAELERYLSALDEDAVEPSTTLPATITDSDEQTPAPPDKTP